MTDPAVEARAALTERAAEVERRAMQAYRTLAARFRATEAGRRFAEMADGEAQHFAVLNLAGDFVRAAGGPLPDAAGEAADLDAALPLVEALEAAGVDAGPAAALPAAVEAALRFEMQELPRVAALIASFPESARARTRSGLGHTLPDHYAALEALGRLAGREDLAAAARDLAARAAAL